MSCAAVHTHSNQMKYTILLALSASVASIGLNQIARQLQTSFDAGADGEFDCRHTDVGGVQVAFTRSTAEEDSAYLHRRMRANGAVAQDLHQQMRSNGASVQEAAILQLADELELGLPTDEQSDQPLALATAVKTLRSVSQRALVTVDDPHGALLKVQQSFLPHEDSTFDTHVYAVVRVKVKDTRFHWDPQVLQEKVSEAVAMSSSEWLNPVHQAWVNIDGHPHQIDHVEFAEEVNWVMVDAYPEGRVEGVDPVSHHFDHQGSPMTGLSSFHTAQEAALTLGNQNLKAQIDAMLPMRNVIEKIASMNPVSELDSLQGLRDDLAMLIKWAKDALPAQAEPTEAGKGAG